MFRQGFYLIDGIAEVPDDRRYDLVRLAQLLLRVGTVARQPRDGKIVIARFDLSPCVAAEATVLALVPAPRLACRVFAVGGPQSR